MASRPTTTLEFVQRFWFPLALVCLLLLAIPGFVLFGLNVFGGEGSVNAWLKENAQLTYHIPLAWWLALILLLMPVLVVLLYFLKLKRKPLSVPSTFLWRKSIEDLHVNALFQWLRQNLLLLLQLLVLLFLIYSIMDFRVHGRTSAGKHYIIMIDNSASMAATDVGPSRLHWAKGEAIKEIDAATDNDFGMVIVFNSSAEILQSYTSNRGQLRSAVERIEQTQRPTRIEEALSLADSLANPTKSTDDNSVRPAGEDPAKARTYVSVEGIVTEVHLYSDGRFPDLPEFSLGNLNLQLHTAGRPGVENVNNLAIANFNAQRDDDNPAKMRVFVRVLNFRNQRAPAKVVLEMMVDGKLKAIKDRAIPLPARQVDILQEPGKEDATIRDLPGEQSVTIDLSDVDDRSKTLLHTRLEGNKDDLPLDDEAWLVVGVVRKARVLIVGNPNSVLSAFFDQIPIQAVATITHIPPDDLDKDKYLKPARNGDYDLIVFDRCGPKREEDMPRGNSFSIGHLPPPLKRSAGDVIKNPQIKGWMNKHPVMRSLSALQEVGILEAFRFKDLPPRTPRLLEIDQNTPLLFSLNRASFTDLVMTFPILDDNDGWNTNWPLLPSFPLFLRNVLYALGNIGDGSSEETVQPGQPKTLRPDIALAHIDVTDPAGIKKTLTRGTRADFSYGDSEKVGEYRVYWDGQWQRSFAVNLLDADESNLEPRTSVQIGAVKISGISDRTQPHELWKWLVLVALGLLLTEWYVYNRRVYV